MVPGNIFQRLIQEDDWDGNLQDHDPLGPAQGGHLEDQLQDEEIKVRNDPNDASDGDRAAEDTVQ